MVLEDAGLTILGLKDFPDIKSVPETGTTFEENAMLKARGYFEQTGVPCIADDSGLIVDYLGGLPGVDSHRWLGHEATDLELANAILERMRGVPREKRTARLGGFMVFWDGGHLLKRENFIDGSIAERLIGEAQPGFPYSSIFWTPRFNKPYSQLTHEEHEAVNFRRKSLALLKEEIVKIYS